MSDSLSRIPRRLRRRVRRWWRETPSKEIGQAAVGVGLALVAAAGLIYLLVS